MSLLQAATRPQFWGITPVGKVVFYFLTVLTVLVFAYGIYSRIARYRTGTEDAFDRVSALPRRVGTAARIAFTNEKQFDRDLVGGLMHAFIFWGFLTLFIATAILAFDEWVWRNGTEILLGSRQSFFQGQFYLSYSFVVDAMGLLFVVGLGVAIYRRFVKANERLWGIHTGREDALLVWSLFLLGVGGYLTESLRIVGTQFPAHETISFVGYFGALVLSGMGINAALAEAVYPAVWWSHALLALWFIAWLPYAKPFHMLSSFANIVARDEKAGIRLPKVPPDADPEEIGPSAIEDFSWKQMLDHDACTKCGRCSSVCPAKAAGRPLDPRDVILDLKQYRQDLDAGRTDEVPIVTDGGTSVIDSRTMESCLSCMACMDACPVEIEHVPQFTEMNRRLTEAGEMAEHVQDAMMNVFQQGNTFGDPDHARPEWTETLDFDVPDAREEPVELLWYVGDYPSYDERNRAVARALARLFEEANVDYGILYEDEQTAGNDVRRVGEEGLYEMLVEDNAAAIGDCEFERIVTTDPHAYNTFKNEYPEFDACDWGETDVYHYTQVVDELLDSGQLRIPASLSERVTYHDPCHLGRYNDVYEAPRDVIRQTGVTLDEMPRNRANSFCCGGGGGGLWMDFDEDKPSEQRLQEAVEETDGSISRFVVACPMCVTMFEDGRLTGGFEDDLEVIDITELLVEAIEADGTAPAQSDLAA
ncbi:MAG: 4Fe-4S dicluster domain-containing protein [Salinirussus sp.]